MIVKFLNARIRKVRRVERAHFIDTHADRPGKMSLRCDVPGLKKSSIRKKNNNVSELRVNHIDRAARVDRNAGGVAHARIFKREKGGALGFKFVHKIDGGINEKYSVQSIGRECYCRIQFARALAFVSP